MSTKNRDMQEFAEMGKTAFVWVYYDPNKKAACANRMPPFPLNSYPQISL